MGRGMRAVVGTAVAGVAVVGSALPAFASTAYGTVQSISYCGSYSASTRCTVVLYTGSGNTTNAYPRPTGTVYCPGTAADGQLIYTAIRQGLLRGRYVAVVWGGTTEAINCH